MLNVLILARMAPGLKESNRAEHSSQLCAKNEAFVGVIWAHTKQSFEANASAHRRRNPEQRRTGPEDSRWQNQGTLFMANWKKLSMPWQAKLLTFYKSKREQSGFHNKETQSI